MLAVNLCYPDQCLYYMEKWGDMKQSFFAAGKMTVRRLTDDDWHHLKDHYTAQWGEKVMRDFVGGDPDDRQQWQSKMAEFTTFGLFDGAKMVGSTNISMEGDTAVFAGSLIEDAYKGKGFSALLYEVRLNHLKDTGFDGRVITRIMEANEPSTRAAQRHGFEPVDRQPMSGEGWSGVRVTHELRH